MADSYNELFGLGSHSEDANLEGWWPCQDDAASATVDDQSSNANDGTASRNTSLMSAVGPDSRLTKALDFNGSDVINFGDIAALDGVSAIAVGAWVKWEGTTSDFGGSVSIFRKQQNDGVFALGGGWDGANNKARFWIRTGGTFYNSGDGTTDIADGNWHHVVGVYDGSKIYIYVDGVEENSAAQTGTLNSENDNVYAGAYYNPTIREEWNGPMAEVFAFSATLTAGEVTQLKNGPEPVNSVAPSLSGTETEGQTLSCTTGTWGLAAPFASGSNGTITYDYQWTRSDNASGLNEADISGATSSTYTLTASDVGKYIRCRVRASNTGGADTAADTNSGFTGAIASSGGATNPKGVFGLALDGPFRRAVI